MLLEKHGTIKCAAMLEEWMINGEDSMIGHADKIAMEYGLEKVSIKPSNKKLVKKVIQKTNDLELWVDCMSSNAAVARHHIKVKDRSFFAWPKNKTKALLVWRTGSLKLMTQWKIYNIKRGVGVDCVMPLCDGPDTLEPNKTCQW